MLCTCSSLHSIHAFALPSGLSLNETTIASALKTKGWATGMCGKWHLGTDEYACSLFPLLLFFYIQKPKTKTPPLSTPDNDQQSHLHLHLGSVLCNPKFHARNALH